MLNRVKKNIFQYGLKNFLVLLILVGSMNETIANVSPPKPIVIGSQFSLENIPVSRHRYRVVDDTKLDVAEKTLKDNNYVKLSSGEVGIFLSQNEYSQEDMLAMEIADAKAYVEYCEKLYSQFPDKNKYALYRDAHKLYINYLSSIKPPMNVYLVKVKIYSKETGDFQISHSPNILKVHHGSLSKNIAQYQNAYLIIFVETEIGAVDVTANVNS